MGLTFNKSKGKKDIQNIYDHTIDVFSDTPDFNWTLDEIKHEVKDNWELYSVHHEEDIIAALFFKQEEKSLLTKNTAIKVDFQGSGFSHEIKRFYEKIAKERGLKHIVHYCRIDNFRMYALNESHKYKKSDKKLGNEGHIVEWIKKV